MKQELISFLGNNFKRYCKKVEEDDAGIFVYGVCNMFTMCAIQAILKFANKHHYLYYMSVNGERAYIRIHKNSRI